MHWRVAIVVCMLANFASVMAQASQPNLPAFLSVAQSLASALDPQSSSSSTTSSSTTSSSITSTSLSSSAASTPTTTRSPTTSNISPAAATSSGQGTAAGTTSSGIDARTRNIILGVTIPVGILILAGIILCLLLCCRRRRRTRRSTSPESKFVGNKDWEHGNSSHHGYNSNSSLRTGHSNGIGNGNGNTFHHDAAPLMGAAHHSGPAMSEHRTGPHMFGHSSGLAATHQPTIPEPSADRHPTIPVLSGDHHPPAYEHTNGNPNVQNPFTPVPPIARKPVPNRDSTGSNISGINGHHNGNHHSALKTGAVVGAGALAGAAVMHHHDKNHHDTIHHDRIHHDRNHHTGGIQDRPESLHRPLGSHPHETGMYATAGPVNDYPYERRSTPPFSPDDVGSMHRMSQRFSRGPTEPPATFQQPQTPRSSGGIIAPTAAQRQSLQSRNSSYSDDRIIHRGPSRSPRRRSLTGGGEMWEADTTPPPALPTQSRHNSAEMQYAAPTMAAVRPNRSRHNSGESRHSNPIRTPALPSTRHIARSRNPHLYNAVDANNTDSSTSNDSWESAQAELDPWDDRDTGRYPRFSGGSTNSSAPLMPPTAAWNESRERRWSGDIFNREVDNRHRHSAVEPRRNSGGMERRRLRFSEGEPEYYNEQGLVGRAL